MCQDPREDFLLLVVVQKVWVRQAEFVSFWRTGFDCDELLSIVDWKGSQEHSVEQTEDRGIGADAQS